MPKIKVGLCTILGDEHFTVLERRHGARIHVDIRVQFHHGDFDAARFKNGG